MVTLVASTLAAAWVQAQPLDPGSLDAEAAPSYYTIDTEPVRAEAALVGVTRLSGVTPLAIPGDLSGSFQLDLVAAGYEAQRVRVEFPGAAGPLTLRSPRPTHTGGIVKALVWPGLAELLGEEGDRRRGFGFAASGAVGVTGVLAAKVRERNAEDDFAAMQAIPATSPSARANRALGLAENAAAADAAREAGSDWIWFTASAWGISLLDTYLLSPGPGRMTADITNVRVEMANLSRMEAVLRSLVPGLGQFYAGRPKAGQIAFVSGLVAATGLLVAEHSYEKALFTLAAYKVLYDDPLADPEEILLVRAALDDQEETARTTRTTRNVMAGIAAGVWAANLVDAYIGTQSASARSPLDQAAARTVPEGARTAPTFSIEPTFRQDLTGAALRVVF